ncbi:FAD-dependent oxidoreductase [Brevundimonas sp.]|uniref:NAD(P)/FAD-dependent oxidoreductase n=1 Tax=Brevundimonas sp. TaxID=1871086 RepID=UPI00286CEB96|nr:FAD-dependent oxidoreductase [Brevundimonas sp.]
MFDRTLDETTGSKRRIAVVGAGIAGLSAAWLLSRRHDVVLFEAEDRLGGHSCTVEAPSPDGPVAVDTGFIVYNEPNYPNFTALLDCLGVESKAAHMSFAVSMSAGGFEYSSHGAGGLFAQKRNLASPRFWGMLMDLKRFHRTAAGDLAELDRSLCSLGRYLDDRRYGQAFRDLHLLPQAAAIWSSTPGQMADYPAAAFIRFYRNHRLLEVDMKPTWRTVAGGSRRYVEALGADFHGQVRLNAPVSRIERGADGATLHTGDGIERFDAVVLAVHSDQALTLLAEPSVEERRLLQPMAYGRNRVVLHRDRSFMPRRRSAWAAWNYVGAGQAGSDGAASVTYWMNLLQGLPGPELFVTLNAEREPDPSLVLADREFDHPIFNAAAMEAQRGLGSLQGRNNTWFCGAWFGSGFHEDGLQAGLAVAEDIGGVRRPWSVQNESGRIPLPVPAIETLAA